MIELLLMRCLICGIIVSEVEVRFPELFLHVLVDQDHCFHLANRSRASALICRMDEIGIVGGLLWKLGLGISDVEVLHLDGLSDFFVQLRLIRGYFTVGKVLMRE